MQYAGVLLMVVLWSLSSSAQDLTYCGTGYFIDLSIGYTPTGFGLELCGCSEDTAPCELVHIVLSRENSSGETQLLDCPEITLTERWWREQKDLVDIYYADTCEELPESDTHNDLYQISVDHLNPGDTLSILVCKTDPSDPNIISLSGTPGSECSEFRCAPRMQCPIEERIWKSTACTYELPNFADEVLLFDTCISPTLDVTADFVIMQQPSPGTVVDEPSFVEIQVMDTMGTLISTCDVSVLLADDSPPSIPTPLQVDDIIAGEDFPLFQQLMARDTIGYGDILLIPTDQSIDPYDEDACNGYAVTYRWSARDSCQLFSEVTMSFNVIPNLEGPDFASLPADIDTVYPGESLPILVDLVAVNPDGTTNGINVISSIDPYDEDACNGYAVTYRWEAVDSCGNSSELTESFYVAPHSDPPVFLSLPDSIANIVQGDSLPFIQELTATSIDGDTSGITISLVVDTLNDDPCSTMEISYNWIATDSCGVSSTITQSFLAYPDTTLSDFILAGMDDMMIEVSLACVETAAILLPIVPDDHPDKIVLVTIFDEEWNVIDEFLYTDTIHYDFGSGNSNLVYTISDQCGNEVMDTIQVFAEDVSAPLFICPTEQQIVVEDFGTCSATAAWIVPEAIDNCDEVILTQTGGPLFGSTLGVGTYTIEYTATDESMNSATCTFQFVVAPIDSTSLTCLPYDLYLDSLCNATITKQAILGTDILVCVPELNLEIVAGSDTLRGDTFELGPYYNQPIHYILCEPLLDICCSASITLIDTLPPVIACPDTVRISCLEGIENYVPQLLSDCGNVIWEIRDLGSVSICENSNISEIVTREFIAIDASGNRSEPCVQDILIAYANIDSLYLQGDILFPEEVTLECGDLSIEELMDTVFNYPLVDSIPIDLDRGVCGIYATYSDEIFLDTDCKKVIHRIWTIFEPVCGLSHRIIQGTQTIKIVDNTGPSIEIAEDTTTIFTSLHDCFGYLKELPVSLSDNCQDEENLSFQFRYNNVISELNGIDSVPMHLGVHQVYIIANDGCNNFTYDSLTVIVEDNVRPVAACLDNSIVSITADSVHFSVSSLNLDSYDNCDLKLLQIRKAKETCSPSDLIFGEKVSFCCSDVGQPIEVILRVEDYAGNENFCSGYVLVQEKLRPRITCPPDLLIDCSFPVAASQDTLDPFGHLFGTIAQPGFPATQIPIDTQFIIGSSEMLFGGTSDDNCDKNLEFEITTEANINDCGIGEIRRTFIAVDDAGNKSLPCTQRIIISGDSKLDTSHIQWPSEEVLLEECSITESIDPEFQGRPIIEDVPCTLTGISYEDDYLDFSEEGSSVCSKIIRRWTVINWCDPAPFENAHSFLQVIKISDFEDPIILDCEVDETVLFGVSNECGEIPVSLSKIATDNCSASAVLSWDLQIDLYSDGSNDGALPTTMDSNGVSFNGLLPVGRHLILWSVNDHCGNTAQCSETIVVENYKSPTIIARGLSTSLHSNGTVDVWVDDFQPKGDHPCASTILYTISRFEQNFEQSAQSITLTCADNGATSIKVYASIQTQTDTAIYDEVVVAVHVQDNQNVCGSEGPLNDEGEVQGIIFTDDGRMVPGVEVALYRQYNHELMNENLSDNSGFYDAGTIEKFEQYFVRPSLDDDPLNGVSTLDIVALQRHLLGVQEFDSPFRSIAGDINKDYRLTVSDILEMRRAILALPSVMDHDEPWRFVDADFVFDEVQGPLAKALSDKVWITYDKASVDFVATKIGDVNNSILIEDKEVASNRSIQKLIVDDASLKNDLEKAISFNLNRPLEYLGFQAHIKYDPSVMDIRSVYSPVSDVDLDFHIMDNEIIISAFSRSGRHIPSGEELFLIDIIANKNTLLSEGIELASGRLNSEIYTELDQVSELSLDFQKEITSEFEVGQNHPNPWRDNTSIEFTLNKEGNVLFELFTSSGQLIIKREKPLKPGQHQITLNKSSMLHPGVYYYRLTVGNDVMTKRMVMVE